MNPVQKIYSKFRHGLVLKWFHDRLMELGIEITPYYWIKENISENVPAGLKDEDFKEFNLEELTEKDMPAITTTEEDRTITLALLIKKINTPGVVCYALKHKGQITCFTWYDFKECSDFLRQLPMKANEAYRFDLFTFRPYRGKKLSIYLRHLSGKALRNKGISCVYSFIEALNTPAYKSKLNLDVQVLELHIRFKIFKHFRRVWLIKKYNR